MSESFSKKRVLTEIFLKPLHSGWNEIYKSPLLQQRLNVGRTSRQPDWSQVFDLGQTTLICNVSQNTLVLQVVHWTDQPLKDFIASKSSLVSSQFSLSEQRSRENEQKRFAQFQSASLAFDAQIVPDIQCELNKFAPEQIRSQGNSMQPYTLTVATQSNLVYQVDFSPFMFIKGETIFVRDPQPIKITSNAIKLEQAFLKAFEVARHPLSSQLVNIFGFSVPPKSGIDIAKTVVQSDHAPSESPSKSAATFDKDAVVKGLNIFGQLADKIQKSFQPQTHQRTSQLAQIMGESGNSDEHTELNKLKASELKEKFGQTQALPQVKTQSLVPQGNEHGVVAIKAIHSESLVVVVFSNGQVNVRAVNEHTGKTHNLVSAGHNNDCFHPEAEIKVTNAKIGFASLSGQRKVLGIAYELSDSQNNVSVWNFVLLQISENLNVWSQQEIEQTNSSTCTISQLMMDTLESGQDFNAVLYLWDNSTLESTLIDLRGNCKILDRQMSEKLHKVHDQMTQAEMNIVQISQLNQHIEPEAQEEVRTHLMNRIASIYRFSPQAIEEALKKAVFAWKSKTKRSILSQLEENMQRLEIHNILRLRDTITEIENKNSYVLCINKSLCHNSTNHPNSNNELSEHPFRVVVRPMGISIMKEIKSTVCLSKIEQLINYEVANAYKIASMLSRSTFKVQKVHEFNLNTSQLDAVSLLIRVASGIKLSLSSSLHRIEQSLIVDPTRLSDYFQFAFSQEVQLENLHQNLLQVVEENYGIIQQQIFDVQDKLISYLNDYLTNRVRIFADAKINPMQSSLIMMPKVSSNIASSDLVSVIEKSVLSHISALNQLILDIRMVQEFIDYYSIGQQNLEFFEQKQMRIQRLAIRHQQLLAIKQVFTTRITTNAGQSSAEPPRDTTLLFDILSSDQKMLARMSQAISKTSSSLFDAANDYTLGQFLSLHQNEAHPDNLCTGILRYLDRKSDTGSEFLKAMSEYLKLMPDNFDLDMEVEYFVQVLYSHRSLAEQQRIVDELTNYHSESKMLLEYFRAYNLAKLSAQPADSSLSNLVSEELLSEFIVHINNCMNYLFSKEFFIRSESFNNSSFSLTGKASQQISHKVIECVFVMADQFLQTKSENFSLLILQKAVVAINQGMHMEGGEQQRREISDLIYEKMFNLCNANTENGVKVMYKCCQSMSSLHDRRSQYIKLFFDKVVGTGNITCLKTLVFNDEADIHRVVDKTRLKLDASFQQREPRQRAQQQTFSKALDLKLRVEEMFLQQGIQEEIKLQVNVLSVIAELYNMNDVVCHTLWKFRTECIEDLERIQLIASEFEGSASNMFGTDDISVQEQTMLDHLDAQLQSLEEQHLVILRNILTATQVCMKTLGPDFFIVAYSNNKQSNKRSLDESQQHNAMDIDELPFNLNDKQEGLQGRVSKVAAKQVDQEAVFTICRLILLNESISVGDDACKAAEYLCELNYNDEALKLSQVYNLSSIALSLGAIISKQSEASKSKVQAFFGQSNDVDSLVQRNINELSPSMCLEVCKYLISHSIDIPSSLQTRIQDLSLVAQVIDCYMSVAADYKGLLSFLGDGDQLSSRITRCAEQDLQTVLNLADSVKYYSSTLSDLSRQLEVKMKAHETSMRQHMQIQNDILLPEIVRDNLSEFETLMQAQFKFKSQNDLFHIVAQIEKEADHFISPEDDSVFVEKRDQFTSVQQQAQQMQKLESKIINILKNLKLIGNQKPSQGQQMAAPVGSLFNFGNLTRK